MVFFGVFGNPIKHSKSAEIYAFFAQKIGIKKEYELILVPHINHFDYMFKNFFKSGGLGANITSPFKGLALHLCDKLTERAATSRSVNTIKKENNGILLGDNTDGIGFISDLNRLNWIHNNRIIAMINDKFSVYNILLIGAGGAAQGIIPMLLNIYKCHIYVTNRTLFRAQKLVQYFYHMGHDNIFCISLDELNNSVMKFHIIINATTSSACNSIPNISSNLITFDTKCYDLFYQKNKDTTFIKWCKEHGSHYVSDGLGMLVSQAAHAFFLWHNYLPDVVSTLHYLRST